MKSASHDVLDRAERLLRRSFATRFEFSLLFERSRAMIAQVRASAVESQRLYGESRRLCEDSRRLCRDITRLRHAGKVVDLATARDARAAWLALERASKARAAFGT
jgi:hypothetical protein